MIVAFLFGGMFQYFGGYRLWPSDQDMGKKVRATIYKIVVIYLLFKIGFSGGKAVSTEAIDQVLFTSAVTVVVSVCWTLFVLKVLKAWSKFSEITQISIAAHFGSVSVGTFIAGMAFLEAVGIEVSGSVAIWLAPEIMPSIITNLFGGLLFTVILIYFLFEMGRKASSSIETLAGQFKTTILFGTIIPILGGLFGVSLGYLLNYTPGQMFTMALLMASASYVLAPISMHEILKSLKGVTTTQAERSIATSMALSVGITLPFNIIIGFELYYLSIILLSVFSGLA